MYKYTYSKSFDPSGKFSSITGKSFFNSSSNEVITLDYSTQLTAYEKTNLDQAMIDKGYSYTEMVQGSNESSAILISPNNIKFKINVDDVGILSTEQII